MAALTFNHVYKKLMCTYGPQHWWPGETAFEIMIGAVLTQNTSWVNVERAIANLNKQKALNAAKIVAMPHNRLAMLLKPVGYFNVKATRLKNFCNWYQLQGGLRKLQNVPTQKLRSMLLSVNGVGPETADDILLYAFNRPVFVIDAYTRRLFLRMGMINGDESYEVLRALFENKLARVKGRLSLFNEYHALIVHHAKYFCRTKPLCRECCLRRDCISAAKQNVA